MARRVAPVLYKAFLRTLREYERRGLPCVGIAGTDVISMSLCKMAETRSRFKAWNPEGPPSQAQVRLTDGFSLLRALEKQLRVYVHCHDSARLGLYVSNIYQSAIAKGDSSFAEVIGFSGRDQSLNTILKCTAEWLQIAMRVSMFTESERMDEANRNLVLDALRQKLQDDARSSLVALAQDVALTAPSSIADSNGRLDFATHPKSCLDHVSQVMFSKQKFKDYPFEWVYDGLAPVLLQDVLERRKGMPITLACIYYMIAQLVSRGTVRLGLHPHRPHVPEVPSGVDLRGRTPVTSAQQGRPTLEWMPYVCVQSDEGKFELDDIMTNEAFCVDVSKGGKVTKMSDQQRREILVSAPGWHIEVFAELARIMVIAHQRRGESDAVAFWMWQKMALDPKAEEWDMFL